MKNSYANGYYTIEGVDYAFGSANNQVSQEFRLILDRALTNIPRKIVDWATCNIIFFSSTEEAIAFHWNRHDIRNVRHFVFLCEDLKSETPERQTVIVAHEIAHAKLNHISPVFNKLSDEEVERQENDADDLARKWLSAKDKK